LNNHKKTLDADGLPGLPQPDNDAVGSKSGSEVILSPKSDKEGSKADEDAKPRTCCAGKEEPKKEDEPSDAVELLLDSCGKWSLIIGFFVL
jgi:hypothetical protein